MFWFKTHHHQQRIRPGHNCSRLFRGLKSQVDAVLSRTTCNAGRPINGRGNDNQLHIRQRFHPLNQRTKHAAIEMLRCPDIYQPEFSVAWRPACFRHPMIPRHGIDDVAVRVRSQYLLHPIASAKSQVTRGIKCPVTPNQNSLRPFMAVVRFHDGEPIQEHSRERQSVFLCRFRCQVAKTGFGQSQNHIRLKIQNGLVQRPWNRQRPDEVFIIRDPRAQSWPEPGFSQSVNGIRQTQLRMHQQSVGKIGVARNV